MTGVLQPPYSDGRKLLRDGGLQISARSIIVRGAQT